MTESASEGFHWLGRVARPTVNATPSTSGGVVDGRRGACRRGQPDRRTCSRRQCERHARRGGGPALDPHRRASRRDSGFWQFAVKPTPDLIGTDFAEAASAACALAGSLTTPIKQVIFVSDGVANVGADVTTVLPCGGLVFQTFAVGPASSCAGDPDGLGSLQEIATLTGGSCFEIDDPTSLPDEIVPAIVQSQLVSLELSIDGGASADISGSSSAALLPPGRSA